MNTSGGRPSYPKQVLKEIQHEPDLERAYVLYFDGAFRWVLQKASGGVALYDPDGMKVFGKSFVLSKAHINNEAEYQALFTRLQMCLEVGVWRLIVKGDSLLVIKQLVGVWQVKKDALKEWYYGVIKLWIQFEAIQFKHESHEENKEVNAWTIGELQKDIVAM